MGARTSSYPLGLEFRAPLTIPGGDVAGAEVVRELPEAFSLPVWQALRCVVRWSAAEPGSRSALFDAAAMEEWEVELLLADWDEALRLPVAVIAGVLVDAEGASPERLARACLCVTDWALAHGAVTTALAFAEAAALAWADQPRYAYMVGRLLRTHGRPREAEEWMKRVVRIGRRLEDREAECLGLNSLGNFRYRAGRYLEAIRIQGQALRNARKHGLADREGEILHDLFTATWYAGDEPRAEQYARSAYEHYKHGHPRLPGLAHDVAYSWVLKGHYGRALSVLRDLPSHFTDLSERVRVLASLARAAGGCGAIEIFDDAQQEAREIISSSPPLESAASALVEIAMGATGVARWAIAEDALRAGLEIAIARDEVEVIARADRARPLVEARRAADAARNAMDTEALPRLDAFAHGFVATLQSGMAAGI